MIEEAAAAAGVAQVADVPEGVEAVQRGDRVFVLNHTQDDVRVQGTTVRAGDVAVLPVR